MTMPVSHPNLIAFFKNIYQPESTPFFLDLMFFKAGTFLTLL